ncbi:hypothetical protein CC117_21110 [Parafrankia colletiae]|uniref:Uncharacterized protein n=1 Tax=Parafrankia colletiae TaxID=573497 RepID=A0A1S1QNK9_9ACTN|nr:DUF5947 family protein [Parafrankia colletiae]MCK9900566.1 DUF5947 family protein [Frankia sp. Cpl3]OHV34702.1 hypothetical protein CC117_21110 [Parafrankia colletiae]
MTATLHRFLARDPAAGRAPRCEFCGESMPGGTSDGQAGGQPGGHGHVADLGARSILCVCAGCRLLFTAAGSGGGRYRAIPTRYRYAPRFPAASELLAAAAIPVGLAFFVIHDGQISAFYPSPAGATHCELPSDLTPSAAPAGTAGWLPEPDVEALLVHVTRDGQSGYLLPIDACYRLVGELRLHWRGFDGGAEARARLAAFLADARRRAGTGTGTGTGTGAG